MFYIDILGKQPVFRNVFIGVQGLISVLFEFIIKAIPKDVRFFHIGNIEFLLENSSNLFVTARIVLDGSIRTFPLFSAFL